ncbi:MAG: hypothetical protein LBS74_02030 [Oscillospiraceae bacterium]|nr:hypothetical protein [Oscillospiraceae bacterium]
MKEGLFAMWENSDVEVFFYFIGARKTAATNGYRPAHLIKDNYLTTGIHHYYNVGKIEPNGTAYGTITFISPEFYPKSLWIGKRLSVQEGSKVVGYAIVLRICNPLLTLTDRIYHKIDNAIILMVSNRGNYGFVTVDATSEQIPICYMAICKYENEDTIYLFLCNDNMETENDCDFTSIDEAIKDARRRTFMPFNWKYPNG